MISMEWGGPKVQHLISERMNIKFNGYQIARICSKFVLFFRS